MASSAFITHALCAPSCPIHLQELSSWVEPTLPFPTTSPDELPPPQPPPPPLTPHPPPPPSQPAPSIPTDVHPVLMMMIIPPVLPPPPLILPILSPPSTPGPIASMHSFPNLTHLLMSSKPPWAHCLIILAHHHPPTYTIFHTITATPQPRLMLLPPP